TNREITHVAATPLLAVNTPRADYQETIPDRSEFELGMAVLIPGGALEQNFLFRARLLDSSQLTKWSSKVPASLAGGVIAEVYACEPLDACGSTTIDGLSTSPKCTFVPPLKLVNPIPPKPRAASPDSFQPPSQ